MIDTDFASLEQRLVARLTRRSALTRLMRDHSRDLKRAVRIHRLLKQDNEPRRHKRALRLLRLIGMTQAKTRWELYADPLYFRIIDDKTPLRGKAEARSKCFFHYVPETVYCGHPTQQIPVKGAHANLFRSERSWVLLESST